MPDDMPSNARPAAASGSPHAAAQPPGIHTATARAETDTANRASDDPWLTLHGSWTAAACLGERSAWQHVRDTLDAHPAQPHVGWDLRPVQALDHIGAHLLWRHWGRALPRRLLATEGQMALLERVQRLALPVPAPTGGPRGGWGAWALRRVNQLGLLVLHAIDHMLHFVQMLGQLTLDGLYALRHPRSIPWRDISGHLYGMGATALPITALVGFLIGVVLAYLMALQLTQFGAQAFIVNILGISLIRELGPLLAAILVAGRSGSAITAQIGVMRVTEELDAMRVMGLSHSFRLVMPRALALAVAMPLVSLWTTLAALTGGMLASDMTMDISAVWFLQNLPAAVHVAHLGLAMGKSFVFGICIALVGCHWGLRVQPDTQSLGRGTTASVVSAITVVIVVDALFAIAFRSLGF